MGLDAALIAEENMIPCLSKTMLGVDCPGCGLQRSIVFLLRGEFWEAFLMYPAIYALMGLFGLLIFDYFIKIKQSNTITIVLMILTVSLILINYILKFL